MRKQAELHNMRWEKPERNTTTVFNKKDCGVIGPYFFQDEAGDDRHIFELVKFFTLSISEKIFEDFFIYSEK